MRIVMAGSSGFLGSRLRTRLASDGHDIVQLVRRAPRSDAERRWNPDAGELDPSVLAGADLVVNLAGAGVEDKRWTDSYKQTLLTSRVRPTTTLATAIAGLPADQRPPTLVNSSAIGFYGDTGDTAVDEESPAGTGFFADLCRAWEDSTRPAAAAGVRVVLLRTGLVLDETAGLMKPFAITTRLFIAGPLAGGRNWMPWISVADWTDAVLFTIEHTEISGPVNVVGPDPVRNAEFVKTLGRALHRPTPWPIPRFALRIVLGEFADDAIANQRVLPGVLNRAGFPFRHTTVDDAIRASLRRPR
jgi:uncharacterized protein (TIGR01777 family)